MAKVRITKNLDAIFDNQMTFKDAEDMINKIGKVEHHIGVSKGTFTSNFTHNIHHIHIYKDGISYEIHLTGKQFKKLLPTFKEMGEVKIKEYFWMNHK